MVFLNPPHKNNRALLKELASLRFTLSKKLSLLLKDSDNNDLCPPLNYSFFVRSNVFEEQE